MPIELRQRWSEDEIAALPTGEHDYFERKSGALLAKENYRDSLGKALSAFSNSGGGHLIIGIQDDGTFDGVDEFHKTGRTKTRDWLEQIIPNLVSYPLKDFRVHMVEPSTPSVIPAGKIIVVIDIGDSRFAPHQSEHTKLYYYRAGGRSEPSPHFYLETLRGRDKYPGRDIARAWFDTVINPLRRCCINQNERSLLHDRTGAPLIPDSCRAFPDASCGSVPRSVSAVAPLARQTSAH